MEQWLQQQPYASLQIPFQVEEDHPDNVELPKFRPITSATIYENREPNQNVETYIVKAVTSREEAERLIALGYEFHYHKAHGAGLFRKRVIGVD